MEECRFWHSTGNEPCAIIQMRLNLKKMRFEQKKKRMAPQNHPIKLVSSVFPILICTLNGVDQMITESSVSG